MKRTQLTLAGILLLQLVLILVFRSPFSTASARAETRPLLPLLEAISPDRLEIDGSSDERITLVRRGDDWSIEDLGNFPADGDKVERLLGDLESIEVRRPVVSSERYHEAFKVGDDDNEARVRVWDESGDDPRVDLIVGSSANYRTTNVRLGGQDEVYEIQGLAAYDVRPAHGSWIRKEILDPAAGEIDRLALTNETGRFELERRDGVWVVAAPAEREGAELDQQKVEGLVQAATSLRLADGVGPVDDAGHGFDSPAATLELSWSSGEATLEIGGKPTDEDTQRYVTRSGFGFTGTVWESSVKRLLEDRLDDLEAEEEEG